MVLIEVHRPDGNLVGRCDARCHDAKHQDWWNEKSECHCVCGGTNHGRGICGNTLTWTREAIARLKKEHPENIVTLFGIQRDLFGDKEK